MNGEMCEFLCARCREVGILCTVSCVLRSAGPGTWDLGSGDETAVKLDGGGYLLIKQWTLFQRLVWSFTRPSPGVSGD
jgi:hypothetical protein